MFEHIKEDIRCILERDPAARSSWEVLTSYPGFHAVFFHRLAHACWKKNWRWVAKMIAYFTRAFTGIEIHPGAVLGRRVFIDHGMGVVIGETAEIGNDCTIYQGVTLGGTSLSKSQKRHPTLEDSVVVSAGAKILGGFTVEAGARIGANAVVLKAVPAGATAVGIPARIILKKTEIKEDQKPIDSKSQFSAYGVTTANDPLSETMKSLINNASLQEEQITLLWKAIENLASHQKNTDCVPQHAKTDPSFNSKELNQWID